MGSRVSPSIMMGIGSTWGCALCYDCGLQAFIYCVGLFLLNSTCISLLPLHSPVFLYYPVS